jgi:hypothetical protein
MQWVVGSVRRIRITILYIPKDAGGRMGIRMPETCWAVPKNNKIFKWHVVGFILHIYRRCTDTRISRISASARNRVAISRSSSHDLVMLCLSHRDSCWYPGDRESLRTTECIDQTQSVRGWCPNIAINVNTQQRRKDKHRRGFSQHARKINCVSKFHAVEWSWRKFLKQSNCLM